MLVRKGKFGGIQLSDRALEESTGHMDVNLIRGIYTEHMLSSDSHVVFSPPNNL